MHRNKNAYSERLSLWRKIRKFWKSAGFATKVRIFREKFEFPKRFIKCYALHTYDKYNKICLYAMDTRCRLQFHRYIGCFLKNVPQNKCPHQTCLKWNTNFKCMYIYFFLIFYIILKYIFTSNIGMPFIETFLDYGIYKWRTVE